MKKPKTCHHMCHQYCFGGNPPKVRNPPMRIASAHIHIQRNNATKFLNGPIDNLRGVAGKGPLYMYV